MACIHHLQWHFCGKDSADYLSCAVAFRDAGGQPLVVDGAYIRQWIHMRYKACNFKRYMSESDMSVSRPCPAGLLLVSTGWLHTHCRAHLCQD